MRKEEDLEVGSPFRSALLCKFLLASSSSSSSSFFF
jgi:hypothetical protein